jgi:hypothetical protein
MIFAISWGYFAIHSKEKDKKKVKKTNDLKKAFKIFHGC